MSTRESLLECFRKIVGFALIICLAPGSGLTLPMPEPTVSPDKAHYHPAALQNRFAPRFSSGVLGTNPTSFFAFTIPITRVAIANSFMQKASGGQPQAAPPSQDQLNAQHKRVQDAYREKARHLVGENEKDFASYPFGAKNVNGLPYTSDTIARMIFTRDIYILKLRDYFHQLSADAVKPQADQDARIGHLAALAQRVATADFVLNNYIPVGDQFGVTYSGSAKTIKDRIDALKAAGRTEDADWLSNVIKYPRVQQDAIAHQEITRIRTEEPLLGVNDPSLLGDSFWKYIDSQIGMHVVDAAQIAKLRTGYENFLRFGMTQTLDEINRAYAINNVEGMTEFFHPQYVLVRQLAGAIYGGSNEQARFEEFARLFNDYTASQDEQTRLWLALGAGAALAVVVVVALPVAIAGGGQAAAGTTAIAGASDALATSGAVATAQVASSALNAGTVVGMLIFDGTQWREISTEAANAKNAEAVLGVENVTALQRQASNAALGVGTDLAFVALSGWDVAQVLKQFEAVRALGPTGRQLVSSARPIAQEYGLSRVVDEAMAVLLNPGSNENARSVALTTLSDFGKLDGLIQDARAAGVTQAQIDAVIARASQAAPSSALPTFVSELKNFTAAGSPSAATVPELSTLQRAENGAVKAKQLGLNPEEIDSMLATARGLKGPAGGTTRETLLRDTYRTAQVKELANIGDIDNLVTKARSAGVSEADVQAILKPAAATEVNTWAKLVPNQLKISTAIKEGKTLVVDNTQLSRDALSEMVGTVPSGVHNLIRNNVIFTDALRLVNLDQKISFMQAGRLVHWTPEEFGLLRQVLARPDAANMYIFIGASGESLIFRLFTDDMVAAGNQLLKAPDLPAILQGRALLPTIVKPDLLQFLPPSFLVNPATGNLISAGEVGQLTATQIGQLSPEFVQNAIANQELKTTLQARMRQQAIAILQSGTDGTAEANWAANVIRGLIVSANNPTPPQQQPGGSSAAAGAGSAGSSAPGGNTLKSESSSEPNRAGTNSGSSLKSDSGSRGGKLSDNTGPGQGSSTGGKGGKPSDNNVPGQSTNTGTVGVGPAVPLGGTADLPKSMLTPAQQAALTPNQGYTNMDSSVYQPGFEAAVKLPFELIGDAAESMVPGAGSWGRSPADNSGVTTFTSPNGQTIVTVAHNDLGPGYLVYRFERSNSQRLKDLMNQPLGVESATSTGTPAPSGIPSAANAGAGVGVGTGGTGEGPVGLGRGQPHGGDLVAGHGQQGGTNAAAPVDGGANPGSGWIAVGKGVRAGDFSAMTTVVRKYLTGQKKNASYWKATHNPDGSVTYTSPDGQNSLIAKSENGQVLILPRTRTDTTGSGMPEIDKAASTYLWNQGVRWGAYLWKVTNTDGSATYTTPSGKKSINVRRSDNPLQPYVFQDVTAGLAADAGKLAGGAGSATAAGAALSGAKPNQPGGAVGTGQRQAGNVAGGTPNSGTPQTISGQLPVVDENGNVIGWVTFEHGGWAFYRRQQPNDYRLSSPAPVNVRGDGTIVDPEGYKVGKVQDANKEPDKIRGGTAGGSGQPMGTAPSGTMPGGASSSVPSKDVPIPPGYEVVKDPMTGKAIVRPRREEYTYGGYHPFVDPETGEQRWVSGSGPVNPPGTPVGWWGIDPQTGKATWHPREFPPVAPPGEWVPDALNGYKFVPASVGSNTPSKPGATPEVKIAQVPQEQKLPSGAIFATANVEPDTTIEVQESGYALVATADVVSAKRVNPGDHLDARTTSSIAFDDGTGVIIDTVKKLTGQIQATVGLVSLFSRQDRPQGVPVQGTTPGVPVQGQPTRVPVQDHPQGVPMQGTTPGVPVQGQPTRVPVQDQPTGLPVQNGSTTMYVGSSTPFTTPTISIDNVEKIPDKTNATFLDKSGQKVGQLSTYNGLQVQPSSNIRIATKDSSGNVQQQANVVGGAVNASATVSFDRPSYKAGDHGVLQIRVGKYDQGVAATRFGGAAGLSGEWIKILPLSDVKGLPSQVPFGDVNLPFQTTHPGEARVAVIMPRSVPPKRVANPGKDEVLKKANQSYESWLNQFPK